MNYLAHAYLSFNNPEMLVGNLISDFVKGKKQYDYPAAIQKGIRLHRLIDHFTDTHKLVRNMKSVFRDAYGLYSGVFADIVCDYFLANDRIQFTSPGTLKSFALQVYFDLDNYAYLLPENFTQHFFYMKTHDWLSNYQSEEAIRKSFDSIGRRGKFVGETATAFEIFLKNIDLLRTHYNIFFPQLKDYSLDSYHQLLKAD